MRSCSVAHTQYTKYPPFLLFGKDEAHHYSQGREDWLVPPVGTRRLTTASGARTPRAPPNARAAPKAATSWDRKCRGCSPRMPRRREAIKPELKLALAAAQRHAVIRTHLLRPRGVRQRAGFRSVITAAAQAGFVGGASGGLRAAGARHGLARARIQEFLPGLGDAGGAVAQPLFVSRVAVVGPAGCRAVQHPVNIGIAAACDSQDCQGNAKDWSHDIHRSLPTCPAACRRLTASIVPMAPVRPSSPSGVAAPIGAMPLPRRPSSGVPPFRSIDIARFMAGTMRRMPDVQRTKLWIPRFARPCVRTMLIPFPPSPDGGRSCRWPRSRIGRPRLTPRRRSETAF